MQIENNTHKPTKVIMHIDGDAFFAACEVSRRPDLRGKPVIVGAEKGIATALSYEAKALGVTRTMPVFQIRKYWPQVICLPADFDLYTQMSLRMKTIMRRFVSELEEYSVDECFADITHEVAHLKPDQYISFAQTIQNTLEAELGITYSIGIGSTKVRAKIASKQKKPKGITFLDEDKFNQIAQTMSVGSVWGIGKSSVVDFASKGISTVAQFMDLREGLVQERFSKPHQELWHELHGRSVLNVQTEHEKQKSFQHTRMFERPQKLPEPILAELAYHTEIVCERARYHKSEGNKIYWFLKTANMQYIRDEFRLPRATATPSECMSILRQRFSSVFIPGLMYRSCGVTLSGMVPQDMQTGDLFLQNNDDKQETTGQTVYNVADTLQAKYGKRLVHLASSLQSKTSQHDAEKNQQFPLIFLGEVR